MRSVQYRGMGTKCTTYRNCTLCLLQPLWDQHDAYPDRVQLKDGVVLRVDQNVQLDFEHGSSEYTPLHMIFRSLSRLKPTNKIVYVIHIHTREDGSRSVLAMCQYDGMFLMLFTLEVEEST